MPLQPNMDKLLQLLQRHKITICEANDLVALQDYEIVFIADDSGSMTLSSVPTNQRQLGVASPSRWDELTGTIGMVVDVATCFDPDGVDVFFLNRASVTGVKSRDDPKLTQAMSQPPYGTTPLTETLQQAMVQYARSERPVLFIIATDGEPNGGHSAFRNLVTQGVKKHFGSATFKYQILACTDDESAIGWLNRFDQEFQEVDVMDDYFSEKQQVIRAGRCPVFTRGDWIMKALLGPVSSKFDNWDERPTHTGHDGHGKKKKHKCVLQ